MNPGQIISNSSKLVDIPVDSKDKNSCNVNFKNLFHEKMKKYLEARDRIFNAQPKNYKLPNRIIKARERFRKRREIRKSISETRLNTSNDLRPYATIEIFNRPMRALLDSGASVSVLGHGSLELLEQVNANYTTFNSQIKTACGSSQKIVGKICIPVKFKSKVKNIDFYVTPSLSQPIYLGVNFFKAFEIAQDIFNCVNELSTFDPTLPSDNNTPEMHTLTEDQKQKLSDVVQTFPCFSKRGLGKTHLVEHHIDTGDAMPVKQRHWPYSPAMQSLVYAEVDRMLELGVIEESESPWSSPVILVRKPGKVRLCLDSRKVNALTKKFAYPLPHMEGLLSRLSDTHYISSVDLKDAFFQIPLAETSREKTAFTVPGRPLYQFKVMPFGLCNAAQRMCQLMDKVIPSQYRDTIFVYLDDLLIVSPTFESHLEKLRLVAECLMKANLTINVSKSKFCFKQLKYLGFIVGQGSLRPDLDKINAITSFPIPKSLKQLRSFLGMAGWYRRFIKNFATITSPLTDCTKTKSKFVMTDEGIAAMNKVKEALTTAPVLSEADFSKMFFIQCDASTTGVGSVLFQLDDEGNEKPIYYFSRKLNKAQQKYSVTELECLAAVLSVQKFRPFIEGQSFKIITDHSSLRWLMSHKDHSGRLARWSLKLQAFDFVIEHRRGKDNLVPDALSRSFCEELDVNCQLIDLESPEFESVEYKDIIKTIGDNHKQMPDVMVQEDRFVYKRVKFYASDLENEGDAWKLWVPSGLTNAVIRKAHDPPQMSHGGFAKTLTRLRQYFYWPGMAVEVKSYTDNCDICKSTKAPNQILRPPMGKQFKVERRFQLLYIDLLGPYPRSKLGNTYILIVLDQVTKFPFLKALKNATSPSIISFLSTELFPVFGHPKVIYSDNGKQFVSKLFEEFLTTEGIHHSKPPYYSPQSNASERVNRSIVAAIRAYVAEDHSTWDANLHHIAAALRSGMHSALKMDPYFAVFGQHMVQHGGTYELLEKLSKLDSSEMKVVSNTDRQQIIRDKIQQNLAAAHEKYSKTYNTRSREVSYSAGQEIFRRNHTQSDFSKNINAKFSQKFVKGRIRKILGSNRYEIEDLAGKFVGVYHSKDLRQ